MARLVACPPAGNPGQDHQDTGQSTEYRVHTRVYIRRSEIKRLSGMLQLVVQFAHRRELIRVLEEESVHFVQEPLALKGLVVVPGQV